MNVHHLAATLAVSDAIGLSTTCVRTLCHLQIHSGKSIIISDLSREFNISSAAMTGVCDFLCDRDLIARQPHPEDRRKIVIRITQRGYATLRRIILRQPVDQPKPHPSIP